MEDVHTKHDQKRRGSKRDVSRQLQKIGVLNVVSSRIKEDTHDSRSDPGLENVVDQIV
jgi:hypothetical protein